MKKGIAIVIAVAALAGLGWLIYQRMQETANAPQARRGALAVPVEIAPVVKADIRDVGDFSGTLLPNVQFVMAPRVGGLLVKLTVDVGDSVQPGQLIAAVDDEEYVRQVEAAKAELDVAKATAEDCQTQLDAATKQYDRIKTVYEKKLASELEFDTAEAAFKSQQAKCRLAQAAVAQREAALKEAQVRLAYTKIHAVWQADESATTRAATQPRVIGERFVHKGAMLSPNDPIVSVLDINTLKAVITVIERDYPKLHIGQEAIIDTDAFPGRTFTGKVARIAPLVKETSRQAQIEIAVPNDDRVLKPGMFIRARIVFAVHPQATVAPLSALVRRNNRRGVFTIDPKELKAVFVPVTEGIVEGQQVEILQPALGGQIAVLGQHLLNDGAAVILPGQEPAASQPRPRRKGARP
ncbi:MAG: efflux RND transporter periplasmic adaptor subunit [Planctomycetaceae bacterium]|nr:efflux RND transporter periplasmic adaptor subunit [Planctomycetaceae bacterium]